LRAQDHARRDFGIVAEDHEVLEHEAHVGVLLDQLDDLRRGQLAVAAAVVEELDDGDRAVRIGHEVARIAFQRLAVLVHRALAALAFRPPAFPEAWRSSRPAPRGADQIGVHLFAERLVGVGLSATDQRKGGDGRGGERHRTERQGHGDLWQGAA
jgi:hypothetical protein